MRGFLVFLGVLLLLGGGVVAGARYAAVDLGTVQILDSAPAVREFLTTPMALYAGGGAAAFGLLLIIIGLAVGGRKKATTQAHVTTASKELASEPAPSQDRYASTPDAILRPPAGAPVREPVSPVHETAAPQPKLAPQAAATAPPRLTPAGSAPAGTLAKPQASAAPPQALDPRMLSRKRVQDLVTINDAIKAHHVRHGAFPKADGLAGAIERGPTWIPGLTPEFLPALPRDPHESATTQYVYVSDGANYKLLAQGVSLVGSINVEVLGIKIDPTRNPQKDNAAFGFWTPGFASA